MREEDAPPTLVALPSLGIEPGGDSTRRDLRVGGGQVQLGVEAPALATRLGVERDDAGEGGGKVERPIDNDRCGLEGARSEGRCVRSPLGDVTRVVGPGDLQVADVLRIDLRQRGVARPAGCASIDRPVGGRPAHGNLRGAAAGQQQEGQQARCCDAPHGRSVDNAPPEVEVRLAVSAHASLLCGRDSIDDGSRSNKRASAAWARAPPTAPRRRRKGLGCSSEVALPQQCNLARGLLEMREDDPEFNTPARYAPRGIAPSPGAWC